LPRKIAGVCGIASQLIALTMILVVTVNSPWFSWTEYNISVLGVEGSMKTLFNWGLILTGLLSLIFAIGLRKNLLLSRPGQYGVISLIIGSMGVATIGIFPRSIDLPHDVASVVFFLFLILAFLLIGTASIAAFWRIPWTWNGDAIPQLLNCLPWSLWTIVFGVMLLRNFSPVDIKQEV
jgi:hypothetical membrane protein